MYIERIEGDWLDNPFWTRGFLLTKPADLDRLQKSSVRFVIIDDRKGVAVAPTQPGSSPPDRPAERSAEAAHLLEAARACRKAVRDVFLGVQNGRPVDTGRTGAVVDVITKTLNRHPTAMINLTRLKAMESYTFTHSVAVSALLVRFAQHLNRDEAEIRQIGVAGLLHDIGKMRIDTALLLKTSPLSEAEVDVIRTHPAIGSDILSETSDLPSLAVDICRHHHERLDGTGYPDGLSGSEIGFHARISAICDVFDALTTVRPYKLAWSAERALSAMASWTGHFDLDLLREFALSIGRDARLVAPDAIEMTAATNGMAVNGYSDPGV